MSTNTASAWDSIKTYLENFTHGLESELKHIEQQLGLAAKAEAPKVQAAATKVEQAVAPVVVAAAKSVEAAATSVEVSKPVVETPKAS